MKAIDRYAGQILCALLRTHDRLTPEPAAPENLDRILVIKFWGMGSLILAGPVFKTIRRAYPDSQIHLATLESNKEICELIESSRSSGLADFCHLLDLAGPSSLIPVKIIRFLDQVRNINAQAVIDLEYLTRFSAIVSYVSAAPLRVGFHSRDVWRGNLHNRRVAFSPYWHVTDNFLNLVQHLNDKAEPVREIEIPVTDTAKTEAKKALDGAGVKEDETVIVVNPNASPMAIERRWPEEYFVALLDRIVSAGLGRPVLIGAEDEAEYVKGLHQKLAARTQCANLAGRVGLQGLIGILHRAHLLITNDSGPLHLASLIGTPTISFFGPETPLLFGPVGKNHTVLYKGMECSPCINIYNAKTVHCLKDRPECLYAISVDEAFQAVEQRLAETRG
jgi:ADP-heptose:LPS heptosyltransferase